MGGATDNSRKLCYLIIASSGDNADIAHDTIAAKGGEQVQSVHSLAVVY